MMAQPAFKKEGYGLLKKALRCFKKRIKFIVFLQGVKAPKGYGYSGQTATCGKVLGKRKNSELQVVKKKVEGKSN